MLRVRERDEDQRRLLRVYLLRGRPCLGILIWHLVLRVFRSKCDWAGHEMGTSLNAAGTWGRAKTNGTNSVEELNYGAKFI